MTSTTREPTALSAMPAAARQLIEASADLHRRVARLDDAQADEAETFVSPVRSMHDRLALAF